MDTNKCRWSKMYEGIKDVIKHKNSPYGNSSCIIPV